MIGKVSLKATFLEVSKIASVAVGQKASIAELWIMKFEVLLSSETRTRVQLVIPCIEQLVNGTPAYYTKTVSADLVKHCFKLRELYLNNNQLQGVSVDLVSNCPKLKIFNLSYDQLTFLLLASLENLSKMEQLYLMNNPLKVDTKALPSFLQQAINNAEALARKAEEDRSKGVKRKAEEMYSTIIGVYVVDKLSHQ